MLALRQDPAVKNLLSVRHRLAAALCIASSVACSTVLAYTAPPPSLFRTPESLVVEASSIVLVEAVGASRPSCSLRMLQNWKAAPPPTIGTMCRLAVDYDWMTEFSEHTEQKFWKQRQGV